MLHQLSYNYGLEINWCNYPIYYTLPYLYIKKKTNNVIHVSLLTFIICQIEYVICIIVIYVIVNVAVGNDRLESNQI